MIRPAKAEVSGEGPRHVSPLPPEIPCRGLLQKYQAVNCLRYLRDGMASIVTVVDGVALRNPITLRDSIIGIPKSVSFEDLLS